MFARVTFASHDMNAFAELGRITIAQYRSASEGPQNVDPSNSIILDLMRDEHTIAAEKFVTAETAAALLGWEPAETISRGRQAVAQVLDEEAEYLRSRRREIYRRVAASQ